MAVGLAAIVLAQAVTAGASAAAYSVYNSGASPSQYTPPQQHQHVVQASPVRYYAPAPQHHTAISRSSEDMYHQTYYDSQSMPNYQAEEPVTSSSSHHEESNCSHDQDCWCLGDEAPSPCHPYGYSRYHYWPRFSHGQLYHLHAHPRHVAERTFGCFRH